MIPQEKVCSGIDRLNTIVQKMTELNQPPTDASKLAILRNALQIPSLKSLWLAIALNPNPTYAELTSVCKRYDVATKNEALLDEAHFVTPEKGTKRKHMDKDTTDCSFCGKPGHVAEKCFSRIKERKAAQLKRANRAAEKEQNKEGEISGQKPGSKAYTGCHGCGSKKHVKSNCPKSKNKADTSKKGGKKGLQDYVRKGEESESESDQD
jgi:ribosomal protein S14